MERDKQIRLNFVSMGCPLIKLYKRIICARQQDIISFLLKQCFNFTANLRSNIFFLRTIVRNFTRVASAMSKIKHHLWFLR